MMQEAENIKSGYPGHDHKLFLQLYALKYQSISDRYVIDSQWRILAGLGEIALML